MRIQEKCSCGASTEIETADAKLAQRLVEKWRRVHNHTKIYDWPTRWETPIPYTVTSGAGQKTYSGITQQHRGTSPQP